MHTYHDDGQVKIIQGNALEVLAELPAESVQCVVTSPPYWGLRVYAGEQGFVWGNGHCEHQWEVLESATKAPNKPDNMPKQRAQQGTALRAGKPIVNHGCALCGCWRGAYGLEPTVEMYVEHTVEILREIRRVLRPDGVVFWNIGDSYVASGAGARDAERWPKQSRNDHRIEHCRKHPGSGLKPKDLSLIPFRVALAAQADGWWVRSDIVWAKPNPMPESVEDRPTRSHEYIFMLTKAERYYWDQEAVREKGTSGPSDIKKMLESRERLGGKHKTLIDPLSAASAATNVGQKRAVGSPDGRNIRSVWDMATQPYPDAHFAVFPEALPEKCVLAATREGDIVLDPFSGSGTTLWVARRLGRRAIGIDIAEEYCELAMDRCRQMALQFA